MTVLLFYSRRLIIPFSPTLYVHILWACPSWRGCSMYSAFSFLGIWLELGLCSVMTRPEYSINDVLYIGLICCFFSPLSLRYVVAFRDGDDIRYSHGITATTSSKESMPSIFSSQNEQQLPVNRNQPTVQFHSRWYGLNYELTYR